VTNGAASSRRKILGEVGRSQRGGGALHLGWLVEGDRSRKDRGAGKRSGAQPSRTSIQAIGGNMQVPIVSTSLAAAGVISCLALSACGGSGLSASSTCKEFMDASVTEQHEVTDQLASQYNKPAYSTPLGEPEVPYYCSASPTVTLGDFFQKAED
jgi:hypothetical protein